MFGTELSNACSFNGARFKSMTNKTVSITATVRYVRKLKEILCGRKERRTKEYHVQFITHGSKVPPAFLLSNCVRNPQPHTEQ